MALRPKRRPGKAIRIAFYESARAEQIQRIAARDQALVAYITVIGAYFGFVLSRQLSERPSISHFLSEAMALSALPLICICFTLIVLNHHGQIRAMSAYVSLELFPNLDPTHWDNSKTVESTYGMYGHLRFWGQFFVLSAPLLYSIVFVVRNYSIVACTNLEWLLWTLALLDVGVALSIALIHLRIHGARKALQGQMYSR
jgi:hypothetical protein